MDDYDPKYEFDAPRLFDFGKDDEVTQDHWFGIFYSTNDLIAISNNIYFTKWTYVGDSMHTTLHCVTDYQLKVNWTYWRLYWIYCRHTFEFVDNPERYTTRRPAR